MDKNLQAQPRLPQAHIHRICYQRIQSPDFAVKQGIATQLIRWVKGGAA